MCTHNASNTTEHADAGASSSGKWQIVATEHDDAPDILFTIDDALEGDSAKKREESPNRHNMGDTSDERNYCAVCSAIWEYHCTTCDNYVCQECMLGDMCHDDYYEEANTQNKLGSYEVVGYWPDVAKNFHYEHIEDIRCHCCIYYRSKPGGEWKYRCDKCDKFICWTCTVKCEKCETTLCPEHEPDHEEVCDGELLCNIERAVEEKNKEERCEKARNLA